tara:strand:- start:16148 stop:17203 length:1056 start_codon:yes stop_codon:yes gene_type:complete
MRAFILSAGFGQRLGLIGKEIPKALMPLGGVPQIEFALYKLRKCGVKEVGINLHYKSELIKKTLGEDFQGIKLNYFFEEEILGTAGCLKNAEEFLSEKKEPFFVVNCDAPSSIDFMSALEHHSRGNYLATLILRRSPEATSYGILGVDVSGRLIKFLSHYAPNKKNKIMICGMFTGLSVMSPSIFKHIPSNRFCDIAQEIYPKLIYEDERIGAIISELYWADTGTIERFVQVNRDLLSGDFIPDFDWPTDEFLFIEGEKISWGSGFIEPPVLISRKAKIEKDAVASRNSILMSGSCLSKGSKSIGSIIFSNSFVENDLILTDCVVGPKTIVTSKTRRLRKTVFANENFYKF